MGIPLLPNVQKVRWQLHSLNESALPFLPILMGSSVVDVDIVMRSFSSPIISHLRAKCTSVRRLSLRGSDPSELAFAAFEQLIRELPNLRELSYSSCLTHETWRILSIISAIPELHTLNLTIFDGNNDQIPQLPSDTFRFPNLRVLELSLPRIQHVIDTFLACSFPRLSFLAIDLMSSQPVNADSVATLFDALCKACTPSTLGTFSMSSLELWNGTWESYRVIRPHHLHQLFKFRNLASLSLSPSWLYDLDEQFVKDLFFHLFELSYIFLGAPDRWCRSNPVKKIIGGGVHRTKGLFL